MYMLCVSPVHLYFDLEKIATKGFFRFSASLGVQGTCKKSRGILIFSKTAFFQKKGPFSAIFGQFLRIPPNFKRSPKFNRAKLEAQLEETKLKHKKLANDCNYNSHLKKQTKAWL